MKWLMAFVMAAGLWVGAAQAVEPDEILDDPILEERAREISKDLRCVVCMNQSIDDSDSGIAKKMRILVRDRLQKGDSDEDVVNYMVSRYGDFVLLKPPVKPKTYLLWFGPAAMVGFGLLAVVLYYRRRGKETTNKVAAPLSAAEQARLDALLKDEGERK